jgi:hypothetical protein
MRFHPGQSQRRHRRLVAGFGLALLVAAALGTGTGRVANASTNQPPIPPPVAAYQPGDQVWYGEAPTVVLNPLGSGCQRVPSTGYLATGATARTTGEYSNYWNWSAASAGEPFDWWVYSTGGALYSNGYSGGGGGYTNTPANTEYWKVKNLGADPQAWDVCWSG